MYKLNIKSWRNNLCLTLAISFFHNFTFSMDQLTNVPAIIHEKPINHSSLAHTTHTSTVSSEQGITLAHNFPFIELTNITEIKKHLTAKEESILGSYLNNNSSKDFFTSLIQAVANNQKVIRNTALQVLRKILLQNPTWANSSLFTSVRELVTSNSYEPISIFQLLIIFLEANPKISDDVLDLTVTIINTNTTNTRLGSEIINPLITKLITVSPDCINNILHIAQTDADNKNRTVQSRIGILKILNCIAGLQQINLKPSYLNRLFSIVLEDTQDIEVEVGNEVVEVLGTISRLHDDYTKHAFATLIKSTKSDDYVTRSSSLIILKFFARANAKYTQEIFTTAIESIKDEASIVRWDAVTVLATIIHLNPTYAQNSLDAILQATSDENASVSTGALRLLQTITKLNSQYPQQILGVAIKATKQSSSEVHIEALKLLNTIINSDSNNIGVAFEIANKASQHADEQIRWYSLPILLSIIKISTIEYQEKVYQITSKLINDKFWFIRQDALVILKNIVENSLEYTSKVLPIAIKLLKDEKDTVRLEALHTLRVLLNYSNPKLIEDIYKATILTVKDKNVAVRKQAWEVLHEILKINVHYAQKKELKKSIREACLDTDANIRKITRDLLINYLLKKIGLNSK